MEHKRIPLKDGIYLNIIETDRFKTDYLSVSFVSPLARETASEKSLLTGVLRRGCRKYPEHTGICRRLEELYASEISYHSFKYKNTHVLSFSADILKSRYVMDDTDVFGGTVSLLRDILFDPFLEDGVFSKAYVESEKRNQIDQIASVINNKGRYATKRCIEQMCRGEFASIESGGTIENTKKITPARLYEVYCDIVENSRIEIFFIGDASEDKLLEVLCPMLEGLEKRSPVFEAYETKLSASHVQTVEESASATQGRLVLGFRAGISRDLKEGATLALFNELYGASATSKLFMNVRERLHLCYSCRSFIDIGYGLMFVTAGIDNKNFEIAKKEILDQLASVAAGDVTDDEYESAIRSVENASRAIYDNPSAVEAWFLGRVLDGIRLTPEERFAQICSVTPDEVQKIAGGITLDTVYFLRGDGPSEGVFEDE